MLNADKTIPAVDFRDNTMPATDNRTTGIKPYPMILAVLYVSMSFWLMTLIRNDMNKDDVIMKPYTVPMSNLPCKVKVSTLPR